MENSASKYRKDPTIYWLVTLFSGWVLWVSLMGCLRVLLGLGTHGADAFSGLFSSLLLPSLPIFSLSVPSCFYLEHPPMEEEEERIDQVNSWWEL